MTSDQNAPLHTTPLNDWHIRHGARMVPFAGYSMPVQYDFKDALAARCKGGVMAEHLHTRALAGLFDVSHMGQAVLAGPQVAQALEALVPGDIIGLAPGMQRYSLLLTDAGGIIDDLMVARLDDQRLFMVVNASRKDVDFQHIGGHVPVQILDDRALLALQGPAAATVLARLVPAVAGLPFMGFAAVSIDGSACFVSRSGYTGEDGFEISVPADRAETLADWLIVQPEVVPIGLGARDSLRLEAGLCLYGNDIDEGTTPVEAGLTWTVGKRRRTAWDFPGGSVIRDQIAAGVTRKRVGIRPDDRTIARAPTQIVAADGSPAGVITSGGFGPSVNGPIAMGYVPANLAGGGTPLGLIVRGRTIPARIVPMPFTPHRYKR